jgi:hypothetical protein
MSLITITPLDTPFTRNDLTITNNVIDKFKNGIYVASSSSYSSTNNLAYNVFNGSTSTYWESGSTISGSNPVYVQDPYTNSFPASYVGGGVPTNTYKTKVGSNFIEGEWVQIQIPYRIFIDNYSILPRQDSNSDKFPRKFCLVGSNDGNKWDMIDQQINPKPSTDTKVPTKFSVTTIYSYSYFRLIISEMMKGTTASICQLNLSGYLNLISNNVYLDKGFVYSSGGTVFYNGGENSYLYSENGKNNIMSTNLYTNDSTNLEGFSTMTENKTSDLYISNSIKPFSMLEQSYGSFSITESFDGNVFIPTELLTKAYGNTQTPQYIDAIKEYQLKPLNKLIQQNSELTGNINMAHKQLSGNIDPYLRERNKLLNDKNIDFGGDKVLYKDRKPTLADGLQDDINTMIIKENNLYILGTITLATLLIGIIVVARN